LWGRGGGATTSLKPFSARFSRWPAPKKTVEREGGGKVRGEKRGEKGRPCLFSRQLIAVCPIFPFPLKQQQKKGGGREEKRKKGKRLQGGRERGRLRTGCRPLQMKPSQKKEGEKKKKSEEKKKGEKKKVPVSCRPTMINARYQERKNKGQKNHTVHPPSTYYFTTPRDVGEKDLKGGKKGKQGH